jgi:hypothetical protein
MEDMLTVSIGSLANNRRVDLDSIHSYCDYTT